MNSVNPESTTVCHLVAMPYPGRGHINPMMNLCKLLASKTENILITFVVTEEWLAFIGSEPKPDQIRFATVPNVIPSELVRGADLTGFIEATLTKLEAPFERLLDRLEPPATIVMADTFLFWAVGFGNRRNIPVASYWPMSASMFSVIQHFDLFAQHGHFPVDLIENGHKRVDYIPGVSSTRLEVLIRNGINNYMLGRILEAFSWVPKAQYLLFNSIYQIESQAIDALKAEFSFPLYTIGPAIPYFRLGENSTVVSPSYDELNYFKWLDRQPSNSIMYFSMGSFLSVSSAQMDEIAAGLRDSGVRFFLVARGESSKWKEVCGDMGLVVSWCDQLRVLSHSSIGGFWTHCGQSSVQEGVFAGVPFLTFPISADQFLSSKLIVEDWKTGWRVKEENLSVENVVTRGKISGLVQKFMDLESNEGKEMRRRAKELQEICQHAIAKDGSSQSDINSFIRDISQCCGANEKITS